LTIVVISSCSSPEYLELIPEDTPLVGTIDVTSLGAKVALDKLMELDLFEDIEDQLKEDRQAKKAYKNYVENFSESIFAQIDYLDGLSYFIIPPSSNEEPRAAVAFDIRDNEEIEEGLEDLFDEFDIDIELDELGDNDFGIAYTPFGAIAWDEESGIFVSGSNRDDLEDIVEDIFDSKKDGKNITNNDNFMDFYDDKGDLGMWASAEEFMNLFEKFGGYDYREFNEAFETLDMSMDDLTEETFYSAVLDFNRGESILRIKYDTNDKIKESVEGIYNKGINSEMLSVFPETSLGVASLSMNNSKMLEYIVDNLGKNEKKEFNNREDLLTDLLGDAFEFENIASKMGSAVVSIIGQMEVYYETSVYEEQFDPTGLVYYRDGYEFPFTALTVGSRDETTVEQREQILNGEWVKCPTAPNYTFRIWGGKATDLSWEELVDQGAAFPVYYTAYEGWDDAPTGDRSDEYKDLMGFGVVVEFDNFKEVIEAIEDEDDIISNVEIFEKVQDNMYYILENNWSDPMWISYNDDYFFISNSLDHSESFANQKFEDNNFSDLEYSKAFTNNPISMYLNLDLDNMDSNTEDKITDEMKYDMPNEVFDSLTEILKSIEFSFSEFEGQMILKTKGDKNLFGLILEQLEDYDLGDLM
jgi:hypothetical protein